MICESMFFTDIYPSSFLYEQPLHLIKVHFIWAYTIFDKGSTKGLHLVLGTGCSPLFIVLRLGRWLGLL